MKLSHIFLASLLCSSPAFSTVLYDFESYTGPAPDGTRTSLPNASASWTGASLSATGDPISWVENWSNTTGGTGVQAGAIGTAITNPSTPTATVYGALGGDSILNEKITTTISLVDSDATYPVRDTFGMVIRGSGNSELASLTFTPDSFDVSGGGGYSVSYTTSTGTVQILGTLAYASEYNFSLTFLASGVELFYAPADNSSSNTVYFLPAGYDSGTTFQDIGFSVTQTGDGLSWGHSDNFMLFDNITETSVPEASSLALAGVAALGLLRRRRA